MARRTAVCGIFAAVLASAATFAAGRSSRKASSTSAADGVRLAAAALSLESFAANVSDVRSVAFSPNGSFAITGHWQSQAQIWDVGLNEVKFVLEGHGGAVIATRFCSDGALAVTGAVDGSVILWDVAFGERIRYFSLGSGMVTSVDCGAGFGAPRGGLVVLAGASGGVATLWYATSGEEIRLDANPDAKGASSAGAVAVALSASGTAAMTGSPSGLATLWLWDSLPGADEAETAEEVGVCSSTDPASCEAPQPPRPRALPLRGHRAWILGAAFRPDGRELLTGSHDGSARIWDARTGKLMRTFADLGSISAVAFGSDPRLAFVGDGAGAIKIFDTEGGEELRQFQPRGKVATLSAAPGLVLVGELRKTPKQVKDKEQCQAECAAKSSSTELPVFEVR